MMLNLEPLAAQASLGMTAQGSGSDCDRLITKAAAGLAPLHEERDEPSYWKGLGEQRDGEDGATALRRLLLTKQLVELALNYGRYRAKGMD